MIGLSACHVTVGMSAYSPSLASQHSPVGEGGRKVSALGPLPQKPALDLDPGADRFEIHAALRRAAREYEWPDHRIVEAVPGSGYRGVQPIEHARRGASAMPRQSPIATVSLHSALRRPHLPGPSGQAGVRAAGTRFVTQIYFSRRIERQRQADALDPMQQWVERSTTHSSHPVQGRR